MTLGLARAGAGVVISAARQTDEVRTVADDINVVLGARRVLALQADVTQEADCRRLVDEAIAAFGGLHILVNNAGRGMKYVSPAFLTEPTRFWEVDSDTWRTIVDTNVNGPFLMAKAAVPHMVRQRWGRVINITMNHDTMRRAGFSPYGPSKAALESETVIWAQDLAENRGHRQRTAARRRHRYRHDPGRRTRGRAPPVVAARIDGRAAALARFGGLRGDHGTRLNAARWNSALPAERAATAALENAGWANQAAH
jgi:3-oxoacyl-[acyl-carrier protein] reductase